MDDNTFYLLLFVAAMATLVAVARLAVSKDE